MFLGDNEYMANDELRRNALEKVLLPMLGGLDDSALCQFFIEHLKKVTTVLEQRLVSGLLSEVT